MATNYFAQGFSQGQGIGNAFRSKDALNKAKMRVMQGEDPMVVLAELTQESPQDVDDFVAYVESMSAGQSDTQGMFGNNFGQQGQQQGQGGNQFGQGMNYGQNLGSNLQKIFGGGMGAGSVGASAGSGAASAMGLGGNSAMGALSGGGMMAGGGGATGGALSSMGAAGGGGAASGGGGMLAAAGPWAALAAAILINEKEAKEGGYRSDDNWEYARDLFGGKVMSDDINYRWSPKLFGDDDYGFGGDMEIAGELSTLDFSNAWDKLKNESTLAKLLKKVF